MGTDEAHEPWISRTRGATITAAALHMHEGMYAMMVSHDGAGALTATGDTGPGTARIFIVADLAANLDAGGIEGTCRATGAGSPPTLTCGHMVASMSVVSTQVTLRETARVPIREALSVGTGAMSTPIFTATGETQRPALRAPIARFILYNHAESAVGPTRAAIGQWDAPTVEMFSSYMAVDESSRPASYQGQYGMTLDASMERTRFNVEGIAGSLEHIARLGTMGDAHLTDPAPITEMLGQLDTVLGQATVVAEALLRYGRHGDAGGAPYSLDPEIVLP